ncbi:hypothetical protein LL037_12950 [Clostridium estertheticum]|uniref:hypothetical protein n=1 Tax=Clostridium estertheticum TaxID=238834 RepID=UPI001C0CF675|nr:hypothetical protein [Clostridium estertheticum]MBU3200980.1 hypothetical protein [Clostridium estertheticum]WAG63402.1 hypothetical protein LL037_12950 [Clostridium estertheticum]
MEMNDNKSEDFTLNMGTSTSFLVKIQYRQNTSWQGTIKWLDGRQTRHFRSCLEMMMLIEDALTSDKAKSKDIEFNSWEENDEVTSLSDLEVKRRKMYREYVCKNKK